MTGAAASVPVTGRALRFSRALVALVLLVVLLPGLGAVCARPASAVDIQRVRGGGVEAWLVEDHTNPLLVVSFAFRDGGAVSDPPGQAGRARMVAALLEEGAGELDADAFQARLEELAATLRFDAGPDTLGGTLRTLTRHRDEAFALLRLALTAPRFDEAAVARVRGQVLADLRQAEQDPGDRAQRALAAALFPDHPYGRGSAGQIADVEAISVADLRRYTAERLAKAPLILGVVGDITAGELVALLEATFAPLADAAAPVAIAAVEPAADGRLHVVALPVPQSTVAFAQRGPRRDDPDYDALTVLNHILGGGTFTSRLFREVREERGLVYSISTSLQPQQYSGLWTGFAASGNDRVAETLAVIRAQWQRTAADEAAGGVTDAEVAAAKTFLTGSFPLRFTESGRIADILVAMQRDRLGIDYLDRRNALITAVTVDDVRRVARAWLTPDQLTVVVAGEPVGLSIDN